MPSGRSSRCSGQPSALLRVVLWGVSPLIWRRLLVVAHENVQVSERAGCGGHQLMGCVGSGEVEFAVVDGRGVGGQGIGDAVSVTRSLVHRQWGSTNHSTPAWRRNQMVSGMKW